MTIAIDARYLSKQDTGIYVYLCGVIKLLLDNKFEITLLSPTPLKGSLPLLKRCEVIVLPYNKRRLDSAWTQISLLRFLRSRTFDYYFAPANRGIPVLYRGNTKLVLTVQDVIPLHFFKLYFKKQPIETLAYLLSICSSVFKANRIMAISNASSNDVWRFFHRHATSTLLPVQYMGIKLSSAASSTREKQIVYNGGRDPRKNVPLLLQSFQRFHAKFPDYKLLLMGGGYEVFETELQNLGIRDSTILTGYVSQATKMRILRESAVMIYPSLMEGYGLPIVEALSVGTPVICGTGGSQREVAGKAGIFLEPVTLDSIVESLQLIAKGELPKNYHKLIEEQLAFLLDPSHKNNIIAQFKDS